jgi:hypothetical protein
MMLRRAAVSFRVRWLGSDQMSRSREFFHGPGLRVRPRDSPAVVGADTERLCRSLKYECVYLNAFDNIKDAKEKLKFWFDVIREA